MSNLEVVTYGSGGAINTARNGAREWAGVMVHAAELAKQIAQTQFVPGAMRGNPAAITAAILYGDEIGLGPMTSLATVHVIDGKPALSAEAQRALILAAGHELWLDESNTTRVTWCARRAGSDQTTRVTWTMDDAKRARLDGKPNWRTYPRAMLTARASAEIARAVFADVIRGLAAVEELDDVAPEGDTPAEAQPPARKARNTRKRANVTPTAQVSSGTEPVAEAPTERPPLPGEAGFDQAAGGTDPLPEGWPSPTNVAAIAAREAGLDDTGRHALAYLASDGRTASSGDLDSQQVAQVRAWCVRIKRGELRLAHDGEPFEENPPRLVDVGTARTHAEPKLGTLADPVALTDEPRLIAPPAPSGHTPYDALPGTASRHAGYPDTSDGWLAFAAGRRRQGTMLRKARELSEAAGLMLPGSLDDTLTPDVAAQLAEWIEAK